MPSFDIVSKVDHHELSNAVDQANREIATRFDFKDSGAHFEFTKEQLTLVAPSDFQLKQMEEILINKWVKRKLEVKSLDFKEPHISMHEARQEVVIKQGIDAELSKKVSKLIKNSKLKVQTQTQGEQVRVTGKKRDDLQAVIAFLREQDFDIPLQFENFRD